MLVPTGWGRGRGERTVTGRPVLLTLEAAGPCSQGTGRGDGAGAGGGGRTGGAAVHRLLADTLLGVLCLALTVSGAGDTPLSESGPSPARVEAKSQAPAGAEPEVEPRRARSLPAETQGHGDTGTRARLGPDKLSPGSLCRGSG